MLWQQSPRARSWRILIHFGKRKCRTRLSPSILGSLWGKRPSNEKPFQPSIGDQAKAALTFLQIVIAVPTLLGLLIAGWQSFLVDPIVGWTTDMSRPATPPASKGQTFRELDVVNPGPGTFKDIELVLVFPNKYVQSEPHCDGLCVLPVEATQIAFEPNPADGGQTTVCRAKPQVNSDSSLGSGCRFGVIVVAEGINWEPNTQGSYLSIGGGTTFSAPFKEFNRPSLSRSTLVAAAWITSLSLLVATVGLLLFRLIYLPRLYKRLSDAYEGRFHERETQLKTQLGEREKQLTTHMDEQEKQLKAQFDQTIAQKVKEIRADLEKQISAEAMAKGGLTADEAPQAADKAIGEFKKTVRNVRKKPK